MSFIAELKRRNVIRMAGLYLVGAWLVVQVSSTVLPMFDAPTWLPRSIVVVLAVGFVPALIFSWVFELTPEGIKRDAEVPPEESIASQTARRMDRLLLAVAALAIGYFAFDRFVLAPRREAALVAQTTAHVAAEVRAEASAQPISNKSIAVLPFENLSSDKSNAYFADGIQDEILTGLAKIGDLKVISRTSTQRYASRPDNIAEIAKALGVANILEGSVQRSGNQVRINVQLIAAGSDSHLWAETYDRSLDDVFAVQSEVAQKIADALSAKLSSSERAALAQKPTDVPAAFDAYLKARALESRALQTRSQCDAILDAYREAVRLDPGFALAWAQLARTAFRVNWGGLDPTGEIQADGKRALARADALAPGSAQTELAHGVYMYYSERDFAGALAVMNSLKPKLPNDADVWMWSGYLSRRLGLFAESVDEFERARELTPNDANITYHLGVTLVSMGDCSRGLRELDASLALAPDNTHALAMKLQCAWSGGDLRQADTWLAAADADAPAVQGLRGMQLLLHRDYAAASKRLQQAIAGAGDTVIDAFFNGYLPARVEWQLDLALSQQRGGEAAQSNASYRQVETEASASLAAKTATRYVETGWHAALGLAQAGLGERDAATAQAKLVMTLVPESADRLEGPGWTLYAARIHAMNGDAANAVPLLRHLQATSASLISAENLRIEPFWDPIRNDPGFKALLATPAPKP